MSFSLIAIVMWAAGFFGNSALLAVLVLRQRMRVVPWFASWVIFHLVYTVALFGAYRLGTKHLYSVLYWSGAFVDLLLQVAIIVEIAGFVYRRGGAWVHGAKRLVTAGVGSTLVAVLMAWSMSPAVTSRLEALEARADLAATVVITLFFTAVLVFSHQLGLSWRSFVLREGYGVAAWSVFAFVTDSLHGYWRTAASFKLIDQLQVLGYLGVLGYWIIVLWLPESAPLVPSNKEKNSAESFLQRLK